jgi:rare lipoprotein A
MSSLRLGLIAVVFSISSFWSFTAPEGTAFGAPSATVSAAAPTAVTTVPVKRVQTGFATFLAQQFHGEETAGGEIFDRAKMMAAHRSLPFNSVVRVINLENGRAVTVRIVDRGPYGKNWREGTIIDLSRAAARRLDMIEDGQVRVRVVLLHLGDGLRKNEEPGETN